MEPFTPQLISFGAMRFIAGFDWDEHIKDAEGCR